MMGTVCVCVTVLLSLLSVGLSAPLPSCPTLVQPLDSPSVDMIAGSWFYIAESSEIPGAKEVGKGMFQGGKVKATAISSDTLLVRQTQKMLHQCISITFNMTLNGNTFHLVHPVFQGSEVILKTSCSDCLVIHQKAIIGAHTYGGLQLLSRRNGVTPAELQEFENQVKCLKLPAPLIVNSGRDFCPDQSSTFDSTTVTDLTQAFQGDLGRMAGEMLDKIINTDGGLAELLGLVNPES